MPKELLDKYEQQMLKCVYCGKCRYICPILDQMGWESFSPRGRIKLIHGWAKRDIDPNAFLAERIYCCTECERCVAECPSGVPVTEIIEEARKELVKEGYAPSEVLKVKEAIEAEKNVYQRPNNKRIDWLKTVKSHRKKKVETLYFVGCVTAFSRILRPVVRAVASILDVAGENWTVLNEEWCCGAPLKFGGTSENFKAFIEHNVETIESTGVKRGVFSCPACYRVFKDVYPNILGRSLNFKIMHFVEFAYELVKEGRLKLNKIEAKVTYHDPCELARGLGIIDEPRKLLTTFVDTLIEMPENKANVRCCGGGSTLRAVNSALALSIGQKRIEQAVQVGAEILLTGCPSCKLNLRQATRVSKTNLQVLDITELVVKAIKPLNQT